MKHRSSRRRIEACWRRFAGDRDGAVAIMAALALPVLVGGMALGTEAGYWYLSQRKLQQAADLAAYAAAAELRSGHTDAAMRLAALQVAQSSGARTTDTLAMAHPPSSGGYMGDAMAVEIALTRQQIRFFTLIYSSNPVTIGARAVAEVRQGSDACLLALDPSVSGAITSSGSAAVTFDGCDVATNSTAQDAFNMQGGKVEFTTGCVSSVGGVNATAGLQMTACAAAHQQAPVARDPYADLAQPQKIGTCSKGSISGPAIVVPTDNHPLGMMSKCFNGLDVKGTVTFSPGLYIINGGTFRINASSLVTGHDVAFFLTGGATLAFNGSASINLFAPTTGPLAGILFFGDRADVGAQHTINGNAGSQLSGALYFPSADVSYSGNFTGPNGCTQMVVRRITFTGNATLKVGCTAAGIRRIDVQEQIFLVE